MNRPIKFLVILSIIFISGILINATQNTPEIKEETSKENEVQSNKNTSDLYEIKALKIPEGINFAGERVPLENPDIRERMDRELLVNTYWQSNGLLILKRANKIFPIIEPILAENGIPDDFKYLAVAESALLVNNPSSAKASGLWHFLPRTAKEKRFKLEVNTNVDERYNIEKSTKAAAIYLNAAKNKFGSWTLAAASYNAGMGRVSNNLKTQQVDNYYDALLPDETERYVFRILAIKEVMTHPEKYGFIFDNDDLYTFPETYTVEVDTVITNIAAFAQKFGTNYKTLKIHNPWLRENKLNNKSRKKYYIKLPK